MSRHRKVIRVPKLIFAAGIVAGLLFGAAAGYFLFSGQASPDIQTPQKTETAVSTAINEKPANISPPIRDFTGFTLPEPTGDGPAIRDISSNVTDASIAQYDRLEINFQVDTDAQNLQFPYDAAPPPGVSPGIGVSVDAFFTPDNWETVYKQPAFYYQDFQHEKKEGREWLYPTDNYSWKVRFSPNSPGDWQYKLTAQDSGGLSESAAIDFTVTPSDNKGFIRVSAADPRYFEFDDGTYFPGLGYNLAVPANQGSFPIMAENGIQLVRTWLPSQLSIFGSAWSPWRSFGAAPQGSEPSARLLNNALYRQPGDTPIARPESEVFLWLSHDETVFDDGSQWNFVPCVVLGWQAPLLPVKRNTEYRVRVRYKTQDVTGPKIAGQPFGFTVKTGGWLWDESDESRRCYYPGTGLLAAAEYTGSPYPDPDNPDWQILEGVINNRQSDFLDNFYLALENASAGHVFVDYVWVEEVLGDNQYGPNIVYKPWMAHHQYFDQRNSYMFDQTLELARQNDIYFKLVVLEKNDDVLNMFELDGTAVSTSPGQNRHLFFGNGRETTGKTKTRWLQEAWWRYLQARWGYSPNIHSWELLNEGDPGSTDHYILADEMGEYFWQSFSQAGPEKQHPNLHLVTTSFWTGFPNAFWSSAEYPYIDYADIHHYMRESDTRPLDYLFETSDFYDAALLSEKLSMHHGAKQPDGPGKPVMRGETGFLFDNWDAFAENATGGVWLHNFIWAGVNAGGLIESYWTGAPTQNHLYNGGLHDHRPIYKSFYNFIKDIPLNNGHYQNAAAASSNPEVRVWGQKDVDNGQAHLWIQNKGHTWKNVLDGVSVPAQSVTITLAGFQPNRSYIAEWWDTYQSDPARQIIKTETLTAASDGSLEVNVNDLTSDVAVKILTAGD